MKNLVYRLDWLVLGCMQNDDEGPQNTERAPHSSYMPELFAEKE